MENKVWIPTVIILIFLDLFIPICSICQKPDAPKDGFYGPDQETYSMGESVVYSCFPGYDLLGVTKRMCQASGQWTEFTPFCDRPTTLAMPSWIPDKMVDGNKNTCHHIIHGMTFTMQTPGVVQAVRLHIPSQSQTKITVLTIQNKTIQKCAEYATKVGKEEWVLLKCERTEGVADKVRVIHLGDDENKIDICEVRAYTQNGEWCEYPPTFPISSGYFVVSHDIAALHCLSDKKKEVRYLTCRNNTWNGANINCENEIEVLTASSLLQDSKEDFQESRQSIEDSTNSHSTISILLAGVIILSFVLLGFILYEIWTRKDIGRKLFLKVSWTKMTSDDCHI